MAYKKFGENDIYSNTMRAHPKASFFIWDGNVYYNKTPLRPGTRNVGEQVTNTTGPGFISLYEHNIDRPYVLLGSTGESAGTTVPMVASVDALGVPVPLERANKGVPEYGRIAPWISKDSARSSFKTVGKVSYTTEFEEGDILLGSYPLSASITREFITTTYGSTGYPSTAGERHYVALRNRLDFYSSLSLRYKVSSPYGNKDEQEINLISIPSIFYGTKIKPGTVSLKWNYTGSNIAELRDTRENGELIQVSGSDSSNNGKIAGVVLYHEGILLLTGSWSLSSTHTVHLRDSTTAVNPSWIYFGVGARDGLSQANLNSDYTNASFELDFKGHTETQVVTMYTHARRGETNYSNNPTFLEYNQSTSEFTSSHVYEQKNDIRIKNTVSSSYEDYNAPFQRQVYVSKIAVFDKYKNIIGIASLSNPVLKKEDQDISFKIKLDI